MINELWSWPTDTVVAVHHPAADMELISGRLLANITSDQNGVWKDLFAHPIRIIHPVTLNQVSRVPLNSKNLRSQINFHDNQSFCRLSSKWSSDYMNLYTWGLIKMIISHLQNCYIVCCKTGAPFKPGTLDIANQQNRTYNKILSVTMLILPICSSSSDDSNSFLYIFPG